MTFEQLLKDKRTIKLFKLLGNKIKVDRSNVTKKLSITVGSLGHNMANEDMWYSGTTPIIKQDNGSVGYLPYSVFRFDRWAEQVIYYANH